MPPPPPPPCGLTVSVVVRETVPLRAVIVTAVAVVTVDVMMVNALLDDPAGTVTLPGTVATAGLLLVRVTVAAVLTDPVIVTVPAPDPPPVTALGLTETELSVCPGFSTRRWRVDVAASRTARCRPRPP